MRNLGQRQEDLAHGILVDWHTCNSRSDDEVLEGRAPATVVSDKNSVLQCVSAALKEYLVAGVPSIRRIRTIKSYWVPEQLPRGLEVKWQLRLQYDEYRVGTLLNPLVFLGALFILGSNHLRLSMLGSDPLNMLSDLGPMA
ncbi:hypothetical protein HYALB_00011033 [Hymenoscyphus albidus]|uniref:Uncharacterized protein n=1 Tax=Hymenoscyphus albidus TaxID=595503 RepID=A0A9N9Q8G3_9HELO|nr:hypothetical protein HYALB_00011033 [Hymenoscyphus albidus]